MIGRRWLLDEIVFGTDGWRHVISDGFTFDNVQRVAQAIGSDLLEKGQEGKRVVVGFDTRFLSPVYGELVAEVLAGNGFTVLLSSLPVPTPAVSWAVYEQKAAGGVVITASHNPPEYNGLKFKGPYGGSALPELTESIETHLRRDHPVKKIALESAIGSGRIEMFDPLPGYFSQLKRMVDFSRFNSRDFVVVADAMHGAARDCLGLLLKDTALRVINLRTSDNPGFGGVNPEPIEKNLAALRKAITEHRALAGLATDGDADRIGAMDENGAFVDSHRIFALLLNYLVSERQWQGAVVKTFSTTQMIDQLVDQFGRKLYVTPIGFKHICRLMLEDDILIGGEESGGIGIKNHLPERDGILAGLLLLEIMVSSGKTLKELCDDLMDTLGPHYYRRLDLRLNQPARIDGDWLMPPPKTLAGRLVEREDSLDGRKYFLQDGAWILFRPSGTEPVVRIYAEAGSVNEAEDLLQAGARHLQDGG